MPLLTTTNANDDVDDDYIQIMMDQDNKHVLFATGPARL